MAGLVPVSQPVSEPFEDIQKGLVSLKGLHIDETKQEERVKQEMEQEAEFMSEWGSELCFRVTGMQLDESSRPPSYMPYIY
eukprot:m51a1_g13044 hypothetical protein (81) ;mRNA; f:91-577